MKPPRPAKPAGAALVTTMIVVAVLAVVAVAFLQSTGTDRLSSRTGLNYLKARLAAEAGVAAAGAMVADLVRRYPDSATVWQNIGGGAGGAAGTNNEATVLYLRVQATNTSEGARPGQFGSEITLLATPLVSRMNPTNSTLLNTNPVPLNLVSSNLPFATNNANMVNLNATNTSRPRPFVGLRSATNAGAPVTAAQWVYLGAQPGATNANNPAIARYAFWVEDESFKVNVNVATNGPRGAGSLGLSPAEVRLDGSWGSSSNAALRGVNAGTVVTARNGLPESNFPTALTAAIPGNVTDEQAADELKFLTTVHSAGLDLSRGGFKRFNLNTVTNDADVRRSLNRVIAAITNSNSVPNFGQRFYRLATNSAGINAFGAVTNTHPDIYLQKIAANILDYVDDNDQPTIINNDVGFTIRSGKPEFGIEPLGGGTEGTNSIAAMGVENTPRLQEYAIHGRIRELNPIGYNSNSPPEDPVASYRISIDHYFEFWNPGTRDITINNAFLKIYDQPSFGDNITGPLADEGRPFEIPLNGITFPAGRVTVLTTAPQNELNEALVIAANRTNVVHLDTDAANRIFEGQTRDISVGTAFGGNGFNTYFKVSLRPRSTAVTDYESGILLGNERGIIESFIGLPIVRSNATAAVPSVHFVASSAPAAAVVGESPDIFSLGNAYYTVAGSLAGNSGVAAGQIASASGDPRSLNEQLEIKIYDSSGQSQQTRFLSANLNNNGVPALSSVGAPNNNFVLPANWVDFSSLKAGANEAPLVVRNGSLQSIGEIGHLTDPARVPGSSGALTNVIYSRGGGRTLRIGQAEHPRWYDGNQLSASRTWTSWRLADVFTTQDALSVRGLINPNGALRDGGAALRAALHGMRMLPSPDGSTNTANRPVNVNNVVTNTLARMTNLTGTGLPAGAVNAFWERGEISELPLFNTGSTLAGVGMQQAFDRGREELARRSIEMITTRGSVFTVYAIGQTLQGTNVTGTARMKQTFQIEPQFDGGADAFNDSFVVSNPLQLRARFASPTNYTTRALQTSYD